MFKKTNLYKLIPNWLKIIFFKIGGKKPWSKGYFTFKFKYIKEAINNQQIMKKFKNRENLPKKYGYALDERVVEYPWVLSRIAEAPAGHLLDAGSTLNYKQIIEFPGLKNKKIVIVNLNPESYCFWQKEISYVFADIRELPFRDGYFDYINCISTLEHIGMDNTIHTKDQRYKEEKLFDFEKAVLELKRVLKKGGRLFITVPFGKYQNFRIFQQFDSSRISRVLEIFEPREHQIDYYKYTKEGWNISDEASCRDCEYFDKKSSLGFDSDFAAASRAVACLELI